MPTQPAPAPVPINDHPPGERLAAAVLDGLGDTILILNQEGRVLYANHLATARFETGGVPLPGQAIGDVWPALRAAGLERCLMSVRDGAGAQEFAVHDGRSASGNGGAGVSGRWDSVKVHPLGGGGVLLVAWDITALKRAAAEREERERHDRLLAEAGTLLAGSFPYRTMLQNVADLAVRELADFCYFDVLDHDGDGGLHRVAWAHRDPAQRGRFPDVVHYVPPPDRGHHPIRRVLRTGRAEFLPKMTAADRQLLAMNAAHADYLERLDLTAAIFVPVASRGEVFGVLTLSRLGGGEFSGVELRLAEELGDRAGLALDHARLHDALRDSEARFRSVLAAIPQMVWTSAPDGAIDFVNDRWLDFYHRTAEQSATVEQWREMVHPEDFDAALAAWGRALRKGDPLESELRLRRAEDGAWRWHLTRAVPLRDAAGSIVKWFGTSTDIHALHEVEGARRDADRGRAETLALLDSLLANAPIGFALFDRAHRYVRVNAHLAAINGLPVEAHPGRVVREVAPINAPAVESVLDRVFQTGLPVLDLEITGETPAAPGQPRTWLTGFYPVAQAGDADGDPRPEFVGVVVLEITRQKTLEGELQRRADDLARADRRKDEFLAMLSHELRNPLAAAGNAAALLRPEAPLADRLWAGGVIERQVRHLARLIDDLLDVSRITRDTIRLRKSVLAPATVAREAVECVRALLDERRHVLKFDFPPDLPALEADPTRLEQIFVNLLTNAARYTPREGRITFSARAEDAGRTLVFQVRDNGPGIPTEQRERIFELFTQGDRSLARSEGGLGIGLTVVKRLAELHGGTVRVSSDGPGTGSEFTVRLPAGENDLKAETSNLKSTPSAPLATRARVLVVDDNADTVASMIRLLKLRGFEPLAAARGQEALDVARAERPAVILLDIGLPDLDGYEVAERLRREESAEAAAGRPRALLVAVSGYGQEEDRRRSRDAGFDHHMVKPVEFATLLKLMAEAAGQ